MDRLSTLLSQFGVRANLFFNGKQCGLASYDGAEGRGYIHLLQAGSVNLLGADGGGVLLTRPSLIFMPRPSRHQLFAGESEGAQLLCASMEFGGGAITRCRLHYPTVWCFPWMTCQCWPIR